MEIKVHDWRIDKINYTPIQPEIYCWLSIVETAGPSVLFTFCKHRVESRNQFKELVELAMAFYWKMHEPGLPKYLRSVYAFHFEAISSAIFGAGAQCKDDKRLFEKVCYFLLQIHKIDLYFQSVDCTY